MEIPATRANMAQVQRGRDGRMVEITADVCNVAQDLREIRPNLRVCWSDAGNYFVVYEIEELADGQVKQSMVTTAQQLDQRLVNEVRRIASENYDLVDELDKLDRKIERDQVHAQAERVGEAAELLHHAIRQDFGSTDRIYVPAKAERALGWG